MKISHFSKFYFLKLLIMPLKSSKKRSNQVLLFTGLFNDLYLLFNAILIFQLGFRQFEIILNQDQSIKHQQKVSCNRKFLKILFRNKCRILLKLIKMTQQLYTQLNFLFSAFRVTQHEYFTIFKTIYSIKMSIPKRVDKYQILIDKKLGQGQFGQVYIALDTAKKNKKRAVKVVPKRKLNDQYMKAAFKRQINMMFQVSSVGTVKCYDVLQTEHNFYIVQQFCKNGDFREYLEKNYREGMPIEEAYSFTTKLLSCFTALAEKGITHRDLKPENILMKNKDLKLCDFGFAKASQGDFLQTIVGTPVYMAPQILMRQRYSYKCDVWSIGILIYEMIYGRRPIPKSVNSLIELINWYLKGSIQFPPMKGQDEELKTEMKQFIRNLLKVNEKDRYGWSQIYNHKLFVQNFKYNEKMRLGYIMSALRLSIHSENIDVGQFLDKYKNQRIGLKKFMMLMSVLSTEVTKQDTKYLFELYGKRLPQTNQLVISLNDLKESFKIAGIRMQCADFQEVYAMNNRIQGQRLEQQHKRCENPLQLVEQPLKPGQQIKPTIKCCGSMRKLRLSLLETKIDMHELIQKQSQKVSATHRFQFDEFHNLMLKISPDFKQDLTKRIFKLFDLEEKGSLKLQQIYKTLCQVSGVPYRLVKNGNLLQSIDSLNSQGSC